MNSCLKRTTLLLSTALGLLLFPGAQAAAQTADQPAEAQDDGVEEIVVTATKREETTLDVPMGLTAITGDQLAADQSYRLEDFVAKVPGLNVAQTTGAQLVIRGIATSSASINAPVATYIDETPLVGVGAFSGGSTNTPNLDTFDVARVEVLRGPQGTLYGANALGGLLKYVTNAPDPEGFAARLQVGASTVENGEETGHSLHGMINVPIGDQAAVRIVGYDNLYPGYIDDPSRGLEDINEMRVYGGRASFLLEATPNLTLRINVLDQEREWDGQSFQDANSGTLEPTFCDLCQVRDIDQPGNSSLRYLNGTADWDLGSVELLTSTTYYESEFRQVSDLTPQVAPTVNFLFGLAGVPANTYGLGVTHEYQSDDVVHETRLVSDTDNAWNWQAGFYYTNKDTIHYQPQAVIDLAANTTIPMPQQIVNFYCVDPPPIPFLFPNPVCEVGGTVLPTTYEETALFVNLGYEITPTFDVSVGARYSENSQTFEQIGSGFSPSSDGVTSMSDDVLTWSADARWHVTPDSMVYVRLATGFVPGGPNVAPFGVPPGTVDDSYDPSTTTNYEIGYKTTLLDNHVTVELAAFQIDWEDIQIGIPVPGTQYSIIGNGETAVSRGFEWAINYVPISGLEFAFTGAYTDAQLTADTSGGQDGDPLPITPEWQAALSADYEWALSGNLSAFVGADWRYLGDRWAEFAAVRQELPSYDLVDLRTGLRTDDWTLGVFAKNVGDEMPIHYVLNRGRQAAFVGTPRTIGVEFTANF